MSEKVRILFSFETEDPWIVRAYKSFFDSLAGRPYEVLCTACDVDEPDEQLMACNIIDYAKISGGALRFLADEFASAPPKRFAEQSQKFSIWESPETLLRRFSRFRQAFDMIQPDLVIVWNGMADIRRMVREFLSENGTPFFYAEKGMLHDSWYIDEAGINARCSLGPSAAGGALCDAERNRIECYVRDVISSGSSAWEQPGRVIAGTLRDKLSIGADSPVIFSPGQVDEDTNITEFSSFKSVAEAVGAVAEAMPAEATLIVKPHPKAKAESRQQLEHLAEQFPNLRIVTDANVWDIIEMAELVVSINSTVAFESLVRKRNLLLLGDSILSKVGLVGKTAVTELRTAIKKGLDDTFDSRVDYSRTLSFVKFLLDDYYLFAGKPSISQSVLSRICSKTSGASGKIFSVEELIETYCHGKPAVVSSSPAAKELGKPSDRVISETRVTGTAGEQQGGTLKPKFSVVMVNYNNGRYIGQAIESVLNQTFGDWELVIVDDCSTDDSVDVIRRYLTDNRIRLIRHDTNRGCIAAHKTAVSAVRSDFWGDLDSDDCLKPNAVETMYKHHILSPDCGMIYSQFVCCDKNLKPRRLGFCREIPPGKTNLDVDAVSHFKTFKMRDYLKTPGYDEGLRYAEDKDIAYKIEEVSRLKFVDECLYLYRELPCSQSHGESKAAIGRKTQERAKYAALKRRGQARLATDYFLKAQEEFQRGSFARAAALMAEYRKVLDYSQLPRIQSKSRRRGNIDVSVVIVTYNRTEDVRKCLESLEKQDDTNFEVIVVDNGRTDFEQLEQYVDQYIKCPINFVLSEGRNIGACFAKGKILAFLDDDALVPADFVSSIKGAFQNYDIFGFRGRALPKTDPRANKDERCYDLGPCPFPKLCELEGCSAFRKDIFLSLNGMDPLLFGHEGTDLTYRIISKFGSLNKVIYWPHTVIFHDNIPVEAKEQRKHKFLRHGLSSQYLLVKHNGDIVSLRPDIERQCLPDFPGTRADENAPVSSSACRDGQDSCVVDSRYSKPDFSIVQPCEVRGNHLVSVVMPAYNAQDYISRAIESVLVQNYRNFELIVVDDGSTDRTAGIVRSFKDQRIKYCFKENGGAASSRNFGLKKSSGSFMVMLDSDDMMTPDYIAGHLQAFELFPQADMVYCDDCLIDDQDKPIRVIKRPEYSNSSEFISDMFRSGFPPVHFKTCIRRSVFDTIGLYDERLIVAEDYDMMRRFAQKGLGMCHLQAPLYLRRMNIFGLSKNFSAAKAKSHFEVVRRFTETFAPEQLFPDVRWNRLSGEQKVVMAKYKAAIVYIGIGNQYLRTSAPAFASAAFDMACAELDDCCKIAPAFHQFTNLREKCRFMQVSRV